MARKMKKNDLLCAVFFLAIIFIFGAIADKNFYRFKYYGEENSNYEFKEAGENIQTEYAANFPHKMELVDLNGFVRRMVGEHEMNGVTKLNNGYLTEVAEPIADEQLRANVSAVVQCAAYCKEHGIHFLYIQAPYKISKYDPQLPTGVLDGHNESIDRLLEQLRQNGIETMDLRAQMHADGINQYDLFYKTDHHWTTEGGFYAYQKTAERIAQVTKTTVDPLLLDINNYQIDNYPRWHLGSHGQRTGALFAGIDDYHLIYPKFETHIYNREDQSVKSLYDALIQTDVFSNRNTQSRYTYDSAYKKCDVNTLQSLDAKSDLNVLLFSDSFQEAMKPYMLMTYTNFHGGYWDLSTALIKQCQPDIVVILVYGGNVGAANTNVLRFNDDAAE
ncbi:MAG: DHHW family protein [Bulleidia sp.]